MEENIFKYIDYTVLKPDTKKETVIELCKKAKIFGTASVCINPYYVPLAYSILKDSAVAVCTVVGFPLGASTKEVKAFEAENAIKNGAKEIDMVINIGALKDNDMEKVKEDIKAVFEICRKNKAILKVIIETCFLTETEKEKAANIILSVGADYIKTSTGFSNYRATVEDVKLLKKIAGDKAKIKASGGIKDFETACRMIEAGADRIGASKLISKEDLG